MFSLLAKTFIKDHNNLTDMVVRRKYGMLSGIVGIVLNILLFAGKFFAGTLSGSIAITADAFNNLSDAGSSLITFFGFKFAGMKPDSTHPFGHGRIEYISGLAVSVLVLIMGVELGKTSIEKIFAPQPVESSALAIAILVVSILVKLYMFLYNNKYGKKLDSAAMRATATDCISDAVSTFVVLASVIISSVWNVNIDGWCGILVAVLILYAGYGAAKDTLSSLLGAPPSPEFVEEIEKIVMSQKYVKGIHDLVVHDYGPGRLIISLHAEVPSDENILELHDVIDQTEMLLQRELGCEAVIHMDPIDVNDENVTRSRAMVNEIARSIDENITIHDFRMVSGPTHTNLIFDAVLPYGSKIKDEELKKEIQKKVKEDHPDYFCVIKIDRPYV